VWGAPVHARGRGAHYARVGILTGEKPARRLMSRRMPFWETPSPALPDGRVSSSADLSHPNIAAPTF
jgi:hypothetical protein